MNRDAENAERRADGVRQDSRQDASDAVTVRLEVTLGLMKISSAPDVRGSMFTQLVDQLSTYIMTGDKPVKPAEDEKRREALAQMQAARSTTERRTSAFYSELDIVGEAPNIPKTDDGDDWITWDGGGDCPVEGETRIDAIDRSGYQYKGIVAEQMRWGHIDNGSLDIVKYRVPR